MKQKIEKILKQEPLNKRGYKLIGIGSDKVVLETPGSTRKIIKVSQSVLRKKITDLLVNINSTPQFTGNLSHDIQKKGIDEIAENEKEIREIFGEEHFLKTGVFKIKIPITKEFLLSFVSKFIPTEEKVIVEKLPDDFESEIEMLAETQLVAEELKNPEKFTPIDFSVDVIMHSTFFNEKNIDDALSKARSFVDNEFLNNFRKLFENEKYSNVIKEIVSKIVEYTKKQGR